jgi:hypothetical protein
MAKSNAQRYAGLSNRLWQKGHNPFVELLEGCTDAKAIHMIAQGHEQTVKRLKPALKRNAPPKAITKAYKKKRHAYSTYRRGQGKLNKTYNPFLKLKNSNAWATNRDRTRRRKNVGAWIGSKHPAAATAIWNNYGTKKRKYTGPWKTGKSTGAIKGSKFIQKSHAQNESRLLALGHRDLQNVSRKRLIDKSRAITRRSKTKI